MKMKNISDILKYDKKIEITNTTNFLVDIREKLNDLTQILNMIENQKYNVVIYGLLKLEFVWISEFEKIGLLKQNIKPLFVKLISLGFIEEFEKSQGDHNILVNKLGVKNCDYSKIKLYKLTVKGFNYLATKEISDSLKLIISKDNKNFILGTLKEMNK